MVMYPAIVFPFAKLTVKFAMVTQNGCQNKLKKECHSVPQYGG